MANVVTTAATLDASVIALIDQQVIVSGAGRNRVDQFAETKVEVGGKSMTFTVYSKLAAATTALTDGTDVDATAMADTAVTLTPAEYGSVVTPTKLANLQTDGKADIAAAKLVGINLAETTNKLGITALEAGTGTTAAATSGTLDNLDLRGAYERLATSNIPTFDNGMYVCFLNPAQVTDIKSDFIDLAKYTNLDSSVNGMVGALEGFMIIQDPQVTAGKAICFGMGALGKAVSLEPNTTITGPFDRLGRLMHMGWYGVLAYGVIDDNAVEIITGC